MANGQCTQEHTPKSCIIVLYHYLFFSTHQDGMADGFTHTHTHTHTHIKSSAHSCTADTCLKQTELSIFSPQGLSCLCVRGEDESTMEGKVWPWRRGGAEDVEKRKGRRGVCLNLDALSCQRNTTRLKQKKKIPGSCSAPYSSINTAAAAFSAPAWEFCCCVGYNRFRDACPKQTFWTA